MSRVLQLIEGPEDAREKREQVETVLFMHLSQLFLCQLHLLWATTSCSSPKCPEPNISLPIVSEKEAFKTVIWSLTLTPPAHWWLCSPLDYSDTAKERLLIEISIIMLFICNKMGIRIISFSHPPKYSISDQKIRITNWGMDPNHLKKIIL